MKTASNTPDEAVISRRGYPKYQECKLSWVRQVPSHWQVRKLKHIAAVRVSNVDKKTVDGQRAVRLCNYVDVYKNEYIVPAMNFMDATATDEQIRTFGVSAGDVIITKDSESWDDIAVPAFVPGDLEGVVCGYHLAQVRPRTDRIDGEYLFRCFMAEGICDQFRVAANGITRFGLGKYDVDSSLFPVPPLDEQMKIASFLRSATARIDALVVKKRRLIELLEEQRVALISHTVTKGLDPTVPVKDSGVNWIGQVPRHWEVKPLKHMAHVGNGSTPSRENPAYWSDGVYPWLNSSVVNQESVTEPSDFVTDLALQECHLPRIGPPVVLVGITGQGKTRGMATTLLIEATINQHLAYLKPKPAIMDVSYLRRVLDRAYSFLRSESDFGGSTKGAITCDQLANLKVPCPPLSEQRAIANRLDDKTARLRMMDDKIEAAITKLTEYRTALISAAVTGKIDVREINHERSKNGSKS